MNYEEKYKEALEKAAACLNDGANTEVNILHLKYIFPELNKDKNEEIKKMLFALVNNCGEANFTDVTREAVITWLEQKTIKWTEEDENMFNTAIWHINNSVHNGLSGDSSRTTNWLKSLKERLN